MAGIANIDHRAATTAVRRASPWIAAAHVVVGLLQRAVVAWGLRAASDRTAPQAGR